MKEIDEEEFRGSNEEGEYDAGEARVIYDSDLEMRVC